MSSTIFNVYHILGPSIPSLYEIENEGIANIIHKDR